jgi:protein gp37
MSDITAIRVQWGGLTPKASGRLLEGRTWDEMPDTTTRGTRKPSFPWA